MFDQIFIRHLFVVLFLYACSLVASANTSKDTYEEALLIKPLPSGHVYTHFQFKTIWNDAFDGIKWGMMNEFTKE